MPFSNNSPYPNEEVLSFPTVCGGFPFNYLYPGTMALTNDFHLELAKLKGMGPSPSQDHPHF